MQKLQDSAFTIVKTTSLSSAVFAFLQPTEEFADKSPLGGILSDTKFGWLALGPKFCVVDLRTGLKVAAWSFGAHASNTPPSVVSVVELLSPLTDNSKQLIISLECDGNTGMICIFHINGSQILRCIQTEVVVTQLAVCDSVPDGPFSCFDGVLMAGTKSGEIFVFDLNRSSLIQALKDIFQGYEHLINNELNATTLTFLPINSIPHVEQQRELALENGEHLAVVLNENSLIDGQYIFHNPDGTIRMKAKRDHIRVSSMEYIPQMGSLAVGFNFGAFQIWNIMTLDLEFTSQVNVECLPVTHFAFQEPCDDPRAFCYLWVVYSVMDRFEEEEFPLAVLYSLTYQGKRMLSDTNYLYQDFLTSNIRFQIDLSPIEGNGPRLVGGRCISCNAYSVNSTLGEEGEDSLLNICQLVWECWGENTNAIGQYGTLLFDLDQWYKAQMPATSTIQSSAFISVGTCEELSKDSSQMLAARLEPASIAPYVHAARLEEHFYPNSLHYQCAWLSTSGSCIVRAAGVQRQLSGALAAAGGGLLLAPAALYHRCRAAGLAPLYHQHVGSMPTIDEQRRFLLSVALEARLSGFLNRCAHDWATGTHSGSGCTLNFLVDWCWKRTIELKQNAKELTAPLFSSSALPDRNIVRCLEHCVRQLTELTSLLDSILTKCCNLVVPDALSEMEEKFKGIGTVALYFQVVQWFLSVGLLPERQDGHNDLAYPGESLRDFYYKRRLKLHRLQDSAIRDEEASSKSCPLLYIDQLIEHECGGETVHDMWRKGGSECNGLYPPPSLYSLLRLYLLPDISEQHKHSLVLYLLVDYSRLYNDIRYEPVIRRLMQFPTMFGLSNTAIKATQAFWHLDHRDFDFALDQLQCLTGNTLSDWQHHVVLSALLAQKKSQAALQYLHVRKPAPIQRIMDLNLESPEFKMPRVNDHDKLDDWQPCCNLYLARGLVFEALDVIRMCVQNAGSMEEKLEVLNFFYKACRSTGQLSKMLHTSLQPLEEEVFIRFLEDCNDSQASDILVMYYLQHARYLEAQQCNNKLKHGKTKQRDFTTSTESLLNATLDRDGARDALVEVACGALPAITGKVADYVSNDFDPEPHVHAPKPMSVFVKPTSPHNTFTYKSTFIQDTIQNASETWMNKPKMRRGLKRALNIEETPFLCTPKLNRTKSINIDQDMQTDGTPSKRPKFTLFGTPKTPKTPASAIKVSDKVNKEMQVLLEMPEIQSPPSWKLHSMHRPDRATTPHSILKVRRSEARDMASPVDARYLGESEDEMLETASNHTHCSDSKQLRFTIPTASESESTPSPTATQLAPDKEISTSVAEERENTPPFKTSAAHGMTESHKLESPPKKFASEELVKARKSYKDTVRSRRSLSISANSSLSEDPNTSIESIADIQITLINPHYSHKGKRHTRQTDEVLSNDSTTKKEEVKVFEDARKRLFDDTNVSLLKSPQCRRSIRGQDSPLITRSRSGTPEHQDSPTVTPVFIRSGNRSRSRTPEISPRASPSLAPIPEQPVQEVESEPHPVRTLLSAVRTRSRSRTPEITEKPRKESPRLEVISESPVKDDVLKSPASPVRRSLRSRSRTPEVEAVPDKTAPSSPRSLRSRSKTPDREKLLSPSEKPTRSKKTLSRLVLEHNAFATTKAASKQADDTAESSILKDKSDYEMECTPMKEPKTESTTLLNVTLSPIVNKTLLQSSNDSMLSETINREDKPQDVSLKPLPAFTSLSETYYEKSVLKSYQSSIAEDSVQSVHEEIEVSKEVNIIREPVAEITTSNKSVLKDVSSSLMTSDSDIEMIDNSKQIEIEVEKPKEQDTYEPSLVQKEKQKIVEIQKEINEFEDDISDDSVESQDGDSEEEEEEQERNISGDEESSNTSEMSENESDQEVICINDSTDEETSVTSSENNLQIDERSRQSNQAQSEEIEKPAEIIEATKEVENIIDKDEEMQTCDVPKDDVPASNEKDPLDQTGLSILTDDNSVLESDKSEMNLSYPNTEFAGAENTEPEKNTEKVQEPEVRVEFIVQEVEPVTISEEIKPTASSSDRTDIDVVDAVTANPMETEQESVKNVEKPSDTEITVTGEDSSKPASRARKRATSTSSNKSQKNEATEVRTPTTRKRANSTTINQSATEIPLTPRRIMTRRASKELSQSKLLEESKELEETVVVTPKKRSARSNSNTVDDNASVTSDTSVKSNRSKVSTMSDDGKIVTRKTRKSILVTKPDLSVIPENSTDIATTKANQADEIITEYSKSGRLTRNQKTLLESWLGTTRRQSTASRTSEDIDSESDDLADLEELRNNGSPASISSNTAKPRSRLSRAMSETKVLQKPSKPLRRGSTGVANIGTPEPGSPVPPVASEGKAVGASTRPRRASTTTPLANNTRRSRRTSIDVKSNADSESVASSPEPAAVAATPTRRSRRLPSVDKTPVVDKTPTRSRRTSEK